jgi:hypothetical protein
MLTLVMVIGSVSLAYANEKSEVSIKDDIITEYVTGNINGDIAQIMRITQLDGR